MKKPKEGTAVWFEHARRRCVDHLRALLSIRMAHEYMSKMFGCWATNDIITMAGLHSASVVAYARPFMSALTKDGKVVYPVSALKKAARFDRDLHLHLLSLRNQLITHADYNLLASTMYLQAIGDERLPIEIGITVKGMFGIETRALAERYQVHFLICMTAIEEALNQELQAVSLQAQKHPVEFNATHNVPVSTSEWKITTEDNEFPGPTGPASGVEEPTFPEELSGYRYLTLRHKFALIKSGKYKIHVNGVPREVAFTVD
ncbi:MAG TPA: hypothetical protein VES96_03665 [Nitrospiraceae bacterium]|nr:hypothetical protein [Nitrospiraceae bacterium]